MRDNGQYTYFASDIAYQLEKRERGFDVLLDVLGADHHGYTARVRAGLEAMGEPGESLDVHLMQFVTLYRGGEKVPMSTRAGEFVTLRQLRGEVGNDAARFFYVSSATNSPSISTWSSRSPQSKTIPCTTSSTRTRASPAWAGSWPPGATSMTRMSRWPVSQR